MADLPKALVIQWNGRSLRVKCPYCLETHSHGYCLGNRRQRMSDCHNITGGDYQLVFPEEDDPAAAIYGWEFDRGYSTFVTVNSNGHVSESNPRKPNRSLLPSFIHLHEQNKTDSPSNENSDIAGLESATERLSINEQNPQDPSPSHKTSEEIWEEVIASPKFLRDVYISACITKDIHRLRQLFEKYPDDNFNSQVSDDGDNGVLCAATEENGLATVRWLHERGAAIDRSNHYGRTPLIEAALWGRLEIVQYLTAEGADLHARDANSMNAVELATDSERNVGERALRAGLVYREPANANKQRARVEHHLRHLSNAQLQTPRAPDHSQRGFSFFQRTADGNLVVCRPHNLLQVPNGQSQKAFAELDRGPNYPLVNAMSGYTYPTWSNVLDNDLWANRADDLREYLGLSRDIRFASHVEPQLLTYVLFHHDLVTFTDQDKEVEREARQNLLGGLLPIKLAPIITVNKHDFCPSCRQFFNDFRHRFPSFNIRFRFVGENANGTVHTRP